MYLTEFYLYQSTSTIRELKMYQHRWWITHVKKEHWNK